MFMRGFSIILVNYAIGTQSVAHVGFLFWNNFFCLVFEDETKQSTHKGEKGDQVTVFIITIPSEKWQCLDTRGTKTFLRCLLHAQLDFFISATTIKLHLLLCVPVCLCHLCRRWSAQCCAARWLATTQIGEILAAASGCQRSLMQSQSESLRSN